ncbi:MAG: hypothetical protein A3E21_04085 [Sulfurimonas sp. RIFCSPHIGHO2_12_FULL_36_9]|uniref:DUF262 domain-containing protein n=1 Tax=Sulfurimonas sp. RIFCSPLOWO2_12_36_12 TaxID=1802253 RepID=UPI0008C31EC6|nr:DUF262 domain-containing HNH endonuclease family protein [Sulfurimonas sp. RIFCSPLOWO2_12_36_12]OHD98905.1 MAG: hypothetical protein A3E21_04085 [Sulfurimonas sp. RIFCSPHIGHO2_12_FULL_36_9]OHE00714.1 MAG: hypothetical protein A3J26_05470 [Sulfurimonas sp. RIFCSPLOWO2_02_FULL_36_28]OHE02043.1 MAG: hypothetical protein A2W82_04965 [Sulfurimonas sp. RIFCSPLOWO2_12_36_12]
MQNKTDEIKSLSITELFKDSSYIVPIYQRNYAWSEPEITQLIDDINDYSTINKDKKYYIGSLVVYKRADGKFEVIDGQQRLTTLFILLHVLKHEFKNALNIEVFNLYFESRKKSTLALEKVAKRNIQRDDKTEFKIIDAYEEIHKKLKKKNINVEEFKKYLLDNVVILRTEVPQDTDLNHYFEIMNNRGEQLEKHEILKSRMMDKLGSEPDDMVTFNLIWEACSNMERYVQYEFPINLRNDIFGEQWNEFNIKNFSAIKIDSQTPDKKTSSKESLAISLLIADTSQKIQNPYEDRKIVDSDTPERFTSVVSFPNFLLHVLKIQNQTDIPLDDKRLLETFSDYYKDSDSVKTFAFNLLKLRFLFDKYITKREYTNNLDQWSLKQLIQNKNSKNNTAYYKNTFGVEDDSNDSNENKKILMLLTMFHVSYPTQIYKHWLSGVLDYLFKSTVPINSNSYINHLECMAKNYMKYRYLNTLPLEFHSILFCNPIQEVGTVQWDNLDKGTDVENFIFNYLDYLLWKSNSIGYQSFEFAFRTSVEHYYPQHPMEGIDPLNVDILNSFGNLCLISSSENSRLSNLTPKAKKDYYLKQKNQSLKQQLMMSDAKWEKDEIEKHKNAMICVLQKALNILENKNCHELQ